MAKPLRLAPIAKDRATRLEALRFGACVKVAELQKTASAAAELVVGRIASKRGDPHYNSPKRFRVTNCRASLDGGLSLYGRTISRKGKLGKQTRILGALERFEIMEEARLDT